MRSSADVAASNLPTAAPTDSSAAFCAFSSSFRAASHSSAAREMLSLVGKIAALYVQHFSDSVALASVNEVESLTTGLSRKIWQKVIIIDTILDRQGATATAAPAGAPPDPAPPAGEDGAPS